MIWECWFDGFMGVFIDGFVLEVKKSKLFCIYWDMLMEWRMIADFEEVLAERFDVLCARWGSKSV